MQGNVPQAGEDSNNIYSREHK